MEWVGLLLMLVLGALVSGPLALVLVLTLYGRIQKLEDKLRWQGPPDRLPEPLPKPKPDPTAPSKPESPRPEMTPTPPTPQTPKSPSSPAASYWPVKTDTPSAQSHTPPSPPVAAKTPAAATASRVGASVLSPRKTSLRQAGLEQKLGTTVALIAGIITVIVGVGFFLKYVYENAWFGPVARVCLVAAGGLIAMVVGEITRRRGYEIVAKGTTALGFALLYAAVFSASRVYMLIETNTAFVLAMAITAGAMSYAVVLNEVVIAFLSLLGGYLSPFVISTGQNLAIPLFSYLLALGIGALGCAMFRRWRAVNWIAMAGTYVLFTGWFETFYTPAQMAMTLSWLGVFGGLFLLAPLIYGLVRQVASRAEDVGLVAANSVAVFYYLWRMLHAEHPKAQALAAAVVGGVHLALAAAVHLRCRQDRRLIAALGVLGTGFLTAAVPLYFAALNPTLLSWTVEAAVLTFIGIRYRSRWTKAVAFVISAVAAAGLFYHLPLHSDPAFRFVFNASFGTWLFVAAGVLVCHILWRLMAAAQDDEGRFASQVYYIAALLLAAAGCALEWLAYCDFHIEGAREGQSALLQGMMVVAALLTGGLLARPCRPRGDLVRWAGVLAAVVGSVFTALAMMGVYYSVFRLFINGPFALACGYVAVVLAGAWWMRTTDAPGLRREQMAAALGLSGIALVFVLLGEQGYWYWYCRNAYVQPLATWQAAAAQTAAMGWAVYGLVLLAVGLRFDKMLLKAPGVLASTASAAALLWALPLHTSGDFRLMFNLPFTAWVTVAAALLVGQGLWRMIRIADANEGRLMAQVYYAAAILIAALGWAMEWFAHCRWHIAEPRVGDAAFALGMIVMLAGVVLVLLARPPAPKGELVRALGLLAAAGGAVFVVLTMKDVHTQAFVMFFNVPFGIVALYVAAMMAGAYLVRQTAGDDPTWRQAPAALALSALVLVWIVLSQEVYYYWACRHTYAGPVDNWRFSAQMAISVTWAIYAATLVVGGFVFRTRGVRYLSLLIFAVLLGKIFLKDTVTLRIEYRIAAFLTTGLILVGVSFMYQYLKKKGFFEELGISESDRLATQEPRETHKEPKP